MRSTAPNVKPSSRLSRGIALDALDLVQRLDPRLGLARLGRPSPGSARRTSPCARSRACCFSIARPSAISRAAASRRHCAHVPGKKRPRPASSSSTDVPTVSRNQRSCATMTIAVSSVSRVCSSHSSDSMSRWFVGSSSRSRSGWEPSARASDARVSWPPENVLSWRSRSSSVKPRPRTMPAARSRQFQPPACSSRASARAYASIAFSSPSAICIAELGQLRLERDELLPPRRGRSRAG